jgi:hypothetical protein
MLAENLKLLEGNFILSYEPADAKPTCFKIIFLIASTLRLKIEPCVFVVDILASVVNNLLG